MNFIYSYSIKFEKVNKQLLKYVFHCLLFFFRLSFYIQIVSWVKNVVKQFCFYIKYYYTLYYI